VTSSWTDQQLAQVWYIIRRHRKHLNHPRRLENASWRLWPCKHHALEQCPPEKLNWNKEIDLCFLYGPLMHSESVYGKTCSVPHSPTGLKPALKRPGLSLERLHERSTSSLTMSSYFSNAYHEAGGSVGGSQARTSPGSPVSPVWSRKSYTPPDSFAERRLRFSNEVEQYLSVDESDDTLENNNEDSPLPTLFFNWNTWDVPSSGAGPARKHTSPMIVRLESTHLKQADAPSMPRLASTNGTLLDDLLLSLNSARLSGALGTTRLWRFSSREETPARNSLELLSNSAQDLKQAFRNALEVVDWCVALLAYATPY